MVFEDKESYVANANSPEQDARYRRMAELFAGEPEWHDGEIVYASRQPASAAAACEPPPWIAEGI